MYDKVRPQHKLKDKTISLIAEIMHLIVYPKQGLNIQSLKQEILELKQVTHIICIVKQK